MKFTAVILTSLCFLLAVSSCNDRENLPEHDFSGIFVKPDWTDKGAGVATPGTYEVRAVNTGNNMAFLHPNLSSAGEGNTVLADPAQYKLVVYTLASNITFNKAIASVAVSGNYISASPGWFFAGISSVTVNEGAVATSTVYMKQQVKELVIKLDDILTPGFTVHSAHATLSGVAGTIDMETDALGSPSSTEFDFTVNGSEVTAKIRLFGIVTGSVQTLSGTINYSGGNPPTVFSINVGTKLANFNADKKTPMELPILTSDI